MGNGGVAGWGALAAVKQWKPHGMICGRFTAKRCSPGSGIRAERGKDKHDPLPKRHNVHGLPTRHCRLWPPTLLHYAADEQVQAPRDRALHGV